MVKTLAESEVLGLWISPKRNDLQAVETVEVEQFGLKGDYHTGPLRRSDGREAGLYSRGTLIANLRQITVLYEGDQPRIARKWQEVENLPHAPLVEPEDMLPNILIADLPGIELPSVEIREHLRLRFGGKEGAVLRSTGKNDPCGIPGDNIRKRNEDIRHLLSPETFRKTVAVGLRGTLFIVDFPGSGIIKVHDRVELLKLED